MIAWKEIQVWHEKCMTLKISLLRSNFKKRGFIFAAKDLKELN
jgi:hypothetical protein